MADTLIDSTAAATLQAFFANPTVTQLQAMTDEVVARINAATERRIEVEAAAAAAHEVRKKEIAIAEAHLAEGQQQLANDRQRVEAQMRAIEMRAADMQVRYASGAK
jgi:uncharacterized protein (DUF1800 family)